MRVVVALAVISVLATGCGSREDSSHRPAAQAAPEQAAPKKVEAASSGERVATEAATPPPRSQAPAKAAAPAVLVKPVHRAMGQSLQVLFDRELQEASKAGQQVIVMFTADWCTPCRTIKDLLHDSPVVQKGAAGGRVLLIDVDEWRGPAHRLIPGANPRKLPLLVRVDGRGQSVVQTYGTALGLLSEDAVAKNLGRLVAGQEPERARYMDDPARQRELAIASVREQKAKMADVPELKAEVLAVEPAGDGRERWRLALTIHNTDSRRLWYALPTAAEPPADGRLPVTRSTPVRFEEHVRAGFDRYEGGAATLDVMPVAGFGHATLNGWTVEVPAGTRALHVWRLDNVQVDGKRLRFDKKVPYELDIADASKTRLQAGPTEIDGLSLRVSKALPIPRPAER